MDSIGPIPKTLVRITAYDFDHYRYVPDYNEFGFSYHEEVFKFYNYVQKEYVQPAFNMDSLYCYSSATNNWPNTAGEQDGNYHRPNWGLKSPTEDGASKPYTRGGSRKCEIEVIVEGGKKEVQELSDCPDTPTKDAFLDWYKKNTPRSKDYGTNCAEVFLGARKGPVNAAGRCESAVPGLGEH